MDADLGPWILCPVVSTMQGPGQGLNVVFNINGNEILKVQASVYSLEMFLGENQPFLFSLPSCPLGNELSQIAEA